MTVTAADPAGADTPSVTINVIRRSGDGHAVVAQPIEGTLTATPIPTT